MCARALLPHEYLEKYSIEDLLEEAANECYLAQAQDPLGYFVQYFSRKGSEPLIDEVRAREVVTGFGTATIRVEIIMNGQTIVCCTASQTSCCKRIAPKCRAVPYALDGLPENAPSIKKIVRFVNNTLSPKLRGRPLGMPSAIDAILKEWEDGTAVDKFLGTSTVAALSMAIVVASSRVRQRPDLFSFAEEYHRCGTMPASFFLPVPVCAMLNPSLAPLPKCKIRVREIALIPNLHEMSQMSDILRALCKISRTMSRLLVQRYGEGSDIISPEGGFAFANFDSLDQAITFVEETVHEAGFMIGTSFTIGIHVDGDALLNEETKKYGGVHEALELHGENVCELLIKLVADHSSVTYIEDSHSSDDHTEFKRMMSKLGNTCALVGGKLYSTLPSLVEMGLREKLTNTCMLRVTDVGLVSELLQSARIFTPNRLALATDTEEGNAELIADLAVALGCRYLRVGGMLRLEKTATCNRLLYIQEYLEEKGMYCEPPNSDFVIELPETPPDTQPSLEQVLSTMQKAEKGGVKKK